jgi:hypothetical protein
LLQPSIMLLSIILSKKSAPMMANIWVLLLRQLLHWQEASMHEQTGCFGQTEYTRQMGLSLYFALFVCLIQ